MGKLWNAFRDTPAWDVYKRAAAVPDYYFWRLRGSPMRRVPHLVKQRTVREYARRYRLRLMIETGTHMGQMLQALLPLVDDLYSIEMNPASYRRAVQRYGGDPRVHLIQGDSATELPRLLERIRTPAMFWLDAHNFEIETPIRAELQAIADHFVPGHVILIDDSKWFDGRYQYPTQEWMQDFVARHFPGYRLEDKLHMFRLTPA
jgi:hypothetical protein